MISNNNSHVLGTFTFQVQVYVNEMEEENIYFQPRKRVRIESSFAEPSSFRPCTSGNGNHLISEYFGIWEKSNEIPPHPEIRNQSQVPEEFAFYNANQWLRYCQLKSEWNNKSIKQIVKELERNRQTLTNNKGIQANKKELLNKLIDGMILGRIPYCPHCSHSRLKYNQRDGTYQCLGLFNENKQRRELLCYKILENSAIVRLPWIYF